MKHPVANATTALILLALLAIIAVVWIDEAKESACKRKGGQYVRVSKGALCVKPGSVIE